MRREEERRQLQENFEKFRSMGQVLGGLHSLSDLDTLDKELICIQENEHSVVTISDDEEQDEKESTREDHTELFNENSFFANKFAAFCCGEEVNVTMIPLREISLCKILV